MKIIVDANIVFSTLLNSNSRIGRLLLKGYKQIISTLEMWELLEL
jgi:predicted nucleic acid-binding protein